MVEALVVALLVILPLVSGVLSMLAARRLAKG